MHSFKIFFSNLPCLQLSYDPALRLHYLQLLERYVHNAGNGAQGIWLLVNVSNCALHTEI